MTNTATTQTPPFVVYSKPACVQCDATYRKLDKDEIPYTIIDVSADAEALAMVSSLGYLQAPVVMVNTPTGVEHWAGFKPDFITDAWARIQAAAEPAPAKVLELAAS